MAQRPRNAKVLGARWVLVKKGTKKQEDKEDDGQRDASEQREDQTRTTKTVRKTVVKKTSTGQELDQEDTVNQEQDTSHDGTKITKITKRTVVKKKYPTEAEDDDELSEDITEVDMPELEQATQGTNMMQQHQAQMQAKKDVTMIGVSLFITIKTFILC